MNYPAAELRGITADAIRITIKIMLVDYDESVGMSFLALERIS